MSELQRKNLVFPEIFSTVNYMAIFSLALTLLLRAVLLWDSVALLESASHALEEEQGPVD